jgi:hypothetical protein
VRLIPQIEGNNPTIGVAITIANDIGNSDLGAGNIGLARDLLSSPPSVVDNIRRFFYFFPFVLIHYTYTSSF